jgi:hypothetical protein
MVGGTGQTCHVERIAMGINDFYGFDTTRLLYGQNAFHIPVDFISQRVDSDSGKVWGVFQTSMGLPLMGGSDKTHVLMLGDMFYRPRVIVGSSHLEGTGIAGIAKSGFMDVDAWLDHGDIVLAEGSSRATR